MSFRCIHCGSLVETLFIQYSPGNIRLIKCGSCGLVADEYIECESMILVVDLLLHKSRAYRHLLYNLPSLHSLDKQGMLPKAASLFLLLDAYRQYFLYRNRESLHSSSSSLFSVKLCQEVITDVILGNFVLLCSLCLVFKLLRRSSIQSISFIDFVLATVVSSYFRIALVALMIWQFPVSVVYVIDIFVLSSNAVAWRVLMQMKMSEAIALSAVVHSAKHITNYTELRSLTSISQFVGILNLPGIL